MEMLRRVIVQVGLVIWLILVLSPPAAGQDAVQLKQIEVIADYTTGRVSDLDVILQQRGFVYPGAEDEWAQLPPMRKIAYAFRSAEAGERGGGPRLLAIMAQDLAQVYDGVSLEPTLTEELARGDAKATSLKYQPVTRLPSEAAELPADIVQKLAVLADYAERGPAGALNEILIRDFGLSEVDAWEIQLTRPTKEKALKAGCVKAGVSSCNRAMQSLTRRLSRVYSGMWYERLLSPFLDDGGPDTRGPPGDGPGHRPKPGPRFPGSGDGPRAPDPFSSSAFTPSPTDMPPSPGGVAANVPRPPTPSPPSRPAVTAAKTAARVSNYTRFHRRSYSTPAVRRFGRMARGRRGFGGVVFGNDVARAPGMSRIRTVVFEPWPDSEFGWVRVELADGDQALLGPISAEHAAAAQSMVSGRIDDMAPWTPGDGIGLVGIENQGLVASCDAGTRTVRQGAEFSVVLHPALIDRQLGWSALVVDAQPIAPEPLIEGAADLTSELRHLFDSIGHDRSVGTWKVVDVATRLEVSDGRLVLTRSDGSFPTGLSATGFLEMRPVTSSGDVTRPVVEYDPSEDEDGYDQTFAENFYRLLPALTGSSFDYDNLNRYAAVFSVVRHAASDGATLDLGSTPTTVPTPDRVVVYTDGAIEPSPWTDDDDKVSQSFDSLDACIQVVPDSVVARWEGVDLDDLMFVAAAEADEDVRFYRELQQAESALLAMSVLEWLPVAFLTTACCGVSGMVTIGVGGILYIRRRGRRS